MVEYGRGVGEVAGRSGGGSGLGGGTTDLGGGFAQLLNDVVATVSTVPPELLVAGLLAFLIGLAAFKRAF